jgi:stage V sporulation protein SpoVS
MPESVREVIKVGGMGHPSKWATSICMATSKGKDVELHAIGAGAVNMAVWAAALAGKFMQREVTLTPDFTRIQIDGKDCDKMTMKLDVGRPTDKADG